MILTLATGVPGPQEAELVLAVEQGPGTMVVARRCADAVELVAAVEAGLARVAVVGRALPGLDKRAVERIVAAGAAVIELRGPADPEPSSPLPVTAVAPTVAVALQILPQVSAGPMPVRPPEPQPYDGRAGTVVAVWGPHGSPGRTTVAISLAAQLARRCPGDVLLIDADPCGGTVAIHLGLLDEGGGLPSAIRKARAGELDAAVLAHLSPAVGPFRCLLGLADPERWHLLSPDAIADLLGVARRSARFTVIDAGSGLSDEPVPLGSTPGRDAITLACLRAADHVVAVGACDTVGVIRMVAGLGHLMSRAQPSPSGVTAVLNKVRASSMGTRSARGAVATIEQHTGVGAVTTLPWDQSSCDRAMLGGRTLIEAAPGAPLTRALGLLAAHVARSAGQPLPDLISGAGRGRAKGSRPTVSA